MIFMCNNCEHKPLSKCCDKCKDQPYNCFIFEILIKERGRTNHMSEHMNLTGFFSFTTQT